ncbi:MAG: ribonuclease HIII [Candidatus Thorarchaeota archaeon]|nr:ribonuclease HIII [Candidatus Thorarchaeota archaeon]
MDPIVIKVPSEQVDELRVALLDSENTHPSRTTSEYEAFRFYCGEGLIIGYKSGKIVANSSGAGGLLKRVAQTLERTDDDTITIGSDETGKGEWLGPLTVAAVALNEEQAAYLRSVGVMDSKDLSPRMIGELAYEIEEHSLAIESILISPSSFDNILSEMHGEGKNLNDLLAWAHAKAIEGVFGKINASKQTDIRIVVDEFAEEKTRLKIGEKIDLETVELIQMHRAESVTAVAAASIMARDRRDDWIDQASAKLGFELVGMTPAEALQRKELEDFAKVSYLRDKQN